MIDFYFDCSSPWTYLAFHNIQPLMLELNEPVRWRMPRLDILGFHPRDREQLILGTSGAYSMPMQHLVDIRTGTLREFGGDWPVPPGEPQIYDWFRLKVVGERRPAGHPATAWVDPDLARLQREMEEKFPRRIVELVDIAHDRGDLFAGELDRRRIERGRDVARIDGQAAPHLE